MSDDDASFGRWLREQRRTRDLTQEEMAELLDISPSAVRKFEAGERRPSKQLAEQMAQRLRLQGEALRQFESLVRAPVAAPQSLAIDQPVERRVSVARARPSESPSSNLPVPPTSFVGRQQEQEDVLRLLQRPQTRLLTLLGPPGIGKTRLSIQVAGALVGGFSHGVWWVALAALRDAKLVPAAIAATLGVKENAGEPLLATLKNYLVERQLLLVLDNFEQVLDAAPLIGELLRGAPEIKMLVSSRAALHVYGEQVFPVPSLPVPDPENLPELTQLNQNEAVRLFVERAQAVRPSFSLDEREAPLVAAICEQLEGMPLALELAAARMRLLSSRAIFTRLQSRLDLLEGGAIDLPARQQTLRGAIAWSYDILAPEEQLIFRRLGVFAGGCTVEAAEAVAGDEQAATTNGHGRSAKAYLLNKRRSHGAQAPGLDVAASLEALAGQSLLRVEEGPDGEPRFTMLETIREFAVERLATHDELEAQLRRHAEHYMRLAEQAEPQLTGPDQQKWLVRLDAEHDNIRAALEWADDEAADQPDGDFELNPNNQQPTTNSQRSKAEIGLHIAGALWRFWEVHGQVAEGRQRIEAALQHRTGIPAQVLAKAFNGVGNLAFDEDDYGEAIKFHEASLKLNRELGDSFGIAKSLSNLGNVAHRQGNYALAQTYQEESLALRRELKDWRGIAISLTNLGEIAAEQADYARARVFYEEALALARQMGEQWGTALSLHNLGEVALHQGDYAGAEQLLDEGLQLFRRLGDKRGCALTLGNLGLLARRQRSYDTGEPIYEECLQLFRDLGSKHGIAVALEGLAAIAGGREQVERAAVLRGAAESVRASIGAPRPPDKRPNYERRSLETRARQDDRIYTRAWNSGRNMTLEEAIDYAFDYSAGLSR